MQAEIPVIPAVNIITEDANDDSDDDDDDVPWYVIVAPIVGGLLFIGVLGGILWGVSQLVLTGVTVHNIIV